MRSLHGEVMFKFQAAGWRKAFVSLFTSTLIVLSTAGIASAQFGDPGDDGRPLEDPAFDGNLVDLVTGTGEISSPSISVGEPGAGGLSYSMVFRDGAWRHSFMGGIESLGSNAVFVFIGGFGETFAKSGSTYTNINGSGTTLTFNSSTGTYTYTLRDGTVVEYNAALIGSRNPYDINVAAVQRVTYPNGDVTSYDWVSAQYEQCNPLLRMGGCVQYGPFYRLDSVRTNRGHQIHIEYARDNMTIGPDYMSFMTPVKVTALNNTEHFCSVKAACTPPGAWPTLSITNGTAFSTTRTFTEADGAQTLVTVDSNRRVTSIQTPEASSANIVYSYYTSGTYAGAIATINVDGLTTSYNYSESGGILTTTVTEPGGQTRKAETVVVTGLVRAHIDPGNQRTEYEYDSVGRVTKVTAPEDDYVTYTYDGRGNVTSVKRYPKPGSSLAPLEMTATYPASCSNPRTCNQPTSTTDAAGATTSYTYFSHGGVDTITAPQPGAGLDRPQTRFIYANRTAYYRTSAYSGIAAAPSSVTLPSEVRQCRLGELSSCQSTANEVRRLFTYGSTGVANNLHLTQAEERLGNGSLSAVTQMSWTKLGDMASVDGPVSGSADTTVYRYDVTRRPIGQVGPDPDGAGPRRHAATRITYDDEDRVVTQELGTVTSQSDSAWAAFSRSRRQTVEYDTIGRPTIARAYDSGSTVLALAQYSYYTTGASRGLLECSALRMNAATYGSPPASACSLGTAGAYGPDRITRTAYDSHGRPVTVTEGYGTGAEGIAAQYAYTANGQTDWLKDGEGNQTDYQYDGFDRVAEINYANVAGGDVNWGDDEVFNYAANGRLASRITRSNQTFSYTYDALGRVTAVTAPSGTPGSSYTYDNFSNLVTASAAGRTITNTWDARGRLTTQAGPNGTVSYQYDAASRRARMTWPDAFYVGYDYNTASQLTHIRENGAGSGVGVLAAFTYDDLGRRTALTRGNGTQTTYDFDAAGRLDELVQNLAGTSHDNTDNFAFNPAGQITSRTRSNTGYSFASHINVDTLFGHNGLNQITSVTGSAAPTYDDRGNMDSDGTTSFGYDQYNRLTSAGSASFDYDPLGRLYQSTGPSGTARRQYDGAAMIAVYNTSGGLTERYVHGPGMDEPLVMYAGSGTSNRTFLHADARGSIIAHTNSSGARTAVLTYDEFGNPGPTNTGRYQYTGQTWLSDAGLYHYKNRAYHPGLMRFMQTDPIGHTGGINLYAYVGGDPVNATDPWGLEGEPDCGPEREPDGEGGCQARDRIVVIAERIYGWSAFTGFMFRASFFAVTAHNYTSEAEVCADASNVSAEQMREARSRFMVPRAGNTEIAPPGSYWVSGAPIGGENRFGFLVGGRVETSYPNNGLDGMNQTTPFHAFHSFQGGGTVTGRFETPSGPTGPLVNRFEGRGTNWVPGLNDINNSMGEALFDNINDDMAEWFSNNVEGC